MRLLSRVALLWSGCCATMLAHGADISGCWRSQQVRSTMQDGTFRDSNGDCVIEYRADRIRSSCANERGVVEILSRFERIGPDRLRVTMLQNAAGVAPSPPYEIVYRIVDDWLMFDRLVEAQDVVGPSPTKTSLRPVRFSSVSKRVVEAAGDSCAPLGQDVVLHRLGPYSSLRMNAPAGWVPWRWDSRDGQYAAVSGTDLLVGAFVTTEETFIDGRPAELVIVMDRTRSGPNPVRLPGLPALQERFASEIGGSRIPCAQRDRMCLSIPHDDGQGTYAELLIVAGREVAVSLTRYVPGDPARLDQLRATVQEFVQQLVARNEP